MPKITINEVDLTKASLQPSSTDIAFVPGLSCLSDVTEDFMFCETIADFEKNFGTYPAIIDVYRVYNDNTTGAVSKEKYAIYNYKYFEANFYNEIYKNSIYKKVSKYSGTLSGTTQLVLGFADGTDEADITKYLNDCGLISADSDFDGANKKTVYLDFEYDMSYVYAKELLMMGIPVVYKAFASKNEDVQTTDTYTVSVSDVERSVDVVIKAEQAGDTYTLSDIPVDEVSLVKVGDAELTEASGDTPSAGEYTVNKSTGVITFGTELDENDHLVVVYTTVIDSYTTKFKIDENSNETIVVKVNDSSITKDSNNPPAAGKYYVDLENSIFTFGTPLVENDVLSIEYSVLVFNETYSDMLTKVKNLFTNGSDNEYYDDLLDKGEFSIKYVTSGSYPSFGYEVSGENYTAVEPNYYSNMVGVAHERGDCVALIDPADCSNDLEDNRNLAIEQLINPDNIYKAVEVICGDMPNAEYASMFVPWILYTSQASYMLKSGTNTVVLPQLDSIVMPPSFAYLVTLAKSIRMNSNWLAVAGIARGQVPYIGGLYTTKRLSNTLANYYQPRNGKTSINAITDIKPYGLTIWGNRTMKNNLITAMGGEDGLVATSFLNIRNMVSDVKKTAYVAAKTLMFEQNSDILWINFLSRVTPFLDGLMYGQGLSDYKVIKNQTTEKAKLSATIKLYPLYAVEDFDITIELSDEDVSVV